MSFGIAAWCVFWLVSGVAFWWLLSRRAYTQGFRAGVASAALPPMRIDATYCDGRLLSFTFEAVVPTTVRRGDGFRETTQLDPGDNFTMRIREGYAE